MARLREQIRLANLLADWIKTDNPEIIGAREGFRSRFELAARVSMGVVCFRFVGANEKKLDNLNSELVEQINASGRAYLTQTKLRGRTVMRVGFGNVLTTEGHVRKVWQIIQETASKL